MNIKMKTIKKNLLNVCNKIINKNEQVKKSPKTSSGVSSRASSYTSLNLKTSNSSSGYESASSSGSVDVYVNLDNYFYDENFTSQSKHELKNELKLKQNLIKRLMKYQCEYLQILKHTLTKYIRPLTIVINSEKYFDIFQNIEKIYSMTEFIRNTLNESIQLTNDLYTSTINVIYEYIQMIVDTYEIYLNGYANAIECLKNDDELRRLFNFEEFLDLPIKNITKIYCSFMTLNELKHMNESADEYEKVNFVCEQLKKLMGLKNDLSDLFDNESIYEDRITVKDLIYESNNTNTNNKIRHRKRLNNSSVKLMNRISNRKSIKITSIQALPSDFTDYDGNKHYFL